MRFSVVIPTYDRMAFLPATLAAVFAQRFTDFEVLVVDDGSSDGTAEYLRSLGDRVTVLRQPNRGPGAARNLGLRHAKGRYVAFLDSDDRWFPWTLEAYARMAAEHGEPAILSPSVIEFGEDAELARVAETPVSCIASGDFLSAWRRPATVGSGLGAVRRDALEATGGFTELAVNAEDHDLMLRLGTAPGFVSLRAPAVQAWRRHASGLSIDLGRLVAGCEFLVRREREGAYPGGTARARERRDVIARHVRPVSLECLRRGQVQAGWGLYSRTLGWHLGLNRWRYLLGFPASAAGRALRGAQGPENP